MNFTEKNTKKNINEIVAIVKLISLLFSSTIISHEFCTQNRIIKTIKDSYINLLLISILTIMSIFIYWLWIYFYKKNIKFKHSKIMQVVENLIFITIISLSIILSDTYISQYKFLFIFIIISTTIELGMNYGLLIAITSSMVILTIDLIYAPNNNINIYFQNDLIIVGVFILTAWVLGYYVKIENENFKRKNLQLEELSKELKAQDNKRKYIEDILLNNEACYNLLIENSNQAILVHRNGNFIFVNEGALHLFGFKNESELMGKTIFDLMPIEEQENISQRFEQVNCSKEILTNIPSKLIKIDGTLLDIESTSAYFVYDGTGTILSILRDVTPEKKVEQLQIDVKNNMKLLDESMEFNRLTMELFTNISHELKTPLNVIYAAVQVLSLYNNSNPDFIDKRSKYINVMKQNCYRLTKLINNFLDMSKLESGFLNISLATLNIVSVVEDITLSVATYVESKDISLIFDTYVEEKIMSFDPNKIERIMLNLLSNAIKYTDPGGEILVTITDLNNNISISVKDNGIGIPKDKLDLIFERFGQVDKTLKRACEGTGIGLTLVKSFIEMHGGTIEIKSTIDVGSEFIVTLPAKIIENCSLEDDFVYETNIEKINIEFSDIYSDA